MTLKNKHATRIGIDFELLDWLKAEALRRRCSWSQVIRDLIVSEIERRQSASNQPVPSQGITHELRDLHHHEQD